VTTTNTVQLKYGLCAHYINRADLVRQHRAESQSQRNDDQLVEELAVAIRETGSGNEA
jgi:hypothetical protein